MGFTHQTHQNKTRKQTDHDNEICSKSTFYQRRFARPDGSYAIDKSESRLLNEIKVSESDMEKIRCINAL